MAKNPNDQPLKKGVDPLLPELHGRKLGTQKDLNNLGQGHPGPLLQLSGGQTSQGVGKNREGVVRDSQDARHGPGSRNKGLGAKDSGWNSQLLESDAVVQTAR